MPNHVTNELTAPAFVLDALASEDSLIDFNRAIPMPGILVFEPDSACVDWAQFTMGFTTVQDLQRPTPDPQAAFAHEDFGAASQRLKQLIMWRFLQKGPFPKDWDAPRFAAFLQCCQALKETGYPSWYEWAIEHWGTKWNAYCVKRVAPTQIIFQTAWSPPLPVLRALAQRHPGEILRLRWADEDVGTNVGDIQVQADGTTTGGALENGKDAAYELAWDLLGDDPEA